MFFEIISFICTGLFAGAALYVSLVEHPARLACETSVALTQFRPSYKRAAVMQVILALLDPSRLSTTPDTDVLLRKWGRLHTIRTVASLLSLTMLAANILGYL